MSNKMPSNLSIWRDSWTVGIGGPDLFLYFSPWVVVEFIVETAFDPFLCEDSVTYMAIQPITYLLYHE